MIYDKAKIKDYITTLALAAIPVIITYQAEIGKHVPVEYALLFTIAMGILSQLTAEKRVKEAYKTTTTTIDDAQTKLQEYQNMVAQLQTEIDERQAIVDQIVTPVKETVMTEQ